MSDINKNMSNDYLAQSPVRNVLLGLLVVLHKLLVLGGGVFLARLDLFGLAFVTEHLEDVLLPDDGTDVHHVRHDVPGEVK
jgi:hypothetical protein